MILELHILQNFAPSNLNRDDTGSPKDCEFGGYRRARISSQCFKRAIRQAFKNHGLIDERNLAQRTKRLVDEVASRIHKLDAVKSEDDARRVIEVVLNGISLKVKDDRKTQYLLYLGETEISQITQLCLDHWETLIAIPTIAKPEEAEQSGKKAKGKDAKKAGQEALPKEIRDKAE